MPWTLFVVTWVELWFSADWQADSVSRGLRSSGGGHERVITLDGDWLHIMYVTITPVFLTQSTG